MRKRRCFPILIAFIYQIYISRLLRKSNPKSFQARDCSPIKSQSDTTSTSSTPAQCHFLLVKAQVPISSFFAGPVGEISKSKISIYCCQLVLPLLSQNKPELGGAHRQPQRHTRIRNIHQPAHMPLNRRTAQHQIGLIIIIAETSQVLNRPQTSLPIRHGGIEIVLLALLIHAETLEREIASRTIMRLDGTGKEDGGFHVEVLHAVLHHGQLDGDDACHFNRAAEGDLPVALAEVEVADAELRAGYVHGQEGAAAAGEVLDVAVAAVLGPAWDCAGAFFPDFLFDVGGGGAGVHVLRLRGLRHDAFEVGRVDQVGFALVPGGEDFGAGSAAQDAGVNQPGESDVWKVS